MLLWEAPLLTLWLHRADRTHSTGCTLAWLTRTSHPLGQRMAEKNNVTQEG